MDEKLNLIIIDAREIGNWNPGHANWPVWQGNAKMLVERALADGGVNSMYIDAKSTNDIKAAFEKVAAAFVDTGGVA